MALNQKHYPSYTDNLALSNTSMFSKEQYLESLVDNVNKNNFHIYYSNENSIFKKKIDKLNLKFYLESEKYLSNKTSQVKCQDSLFLILFEQIGIYIEEIKRLNTLIFNRKDDPNFIKERMEDNIRKQKEFETKELLVRTLKESNKKLEVQLYNLITNEDRMKVELERLKRQNNFYKDKLKIYLLTKKNEVDDISDITQKEKYNCSNNHNKEMLHKSSSPNKVIKSFHRSTTNVNSNKNNNNQSVKNLKNYFRRKRNNSDQNQYVYQATNKKKYLIIKTLKENAEIKHNGRRNNNSPLIGNHEDLIQSYDQQLNHLSQIEYFLQEMKQELFNPKENDNETQGIHNIDCFDSQDYSDNNIMKTEIISDIEDYDSGYSKNSALVTINSQERKKSKLPNKTNRMNNQQNPITVGLQNNGNGYHNNNIPNIMKHENKRSVNSNKNVRMKKTQSKIFQSNSSAINGNYNFNNNANGASKKKN